MKQNISVTSTKLKCPKPTQNCMKLNIILQSQMSRGCFFVILQHINKTEYNRSFQVKIFDKSSLRIALGSNMDQFLNIQLSSAPIKTAQTITRITFSRLGGNAFEKIQYSNVL